MLAQHPSDAAAFAIISIFGTLFVLFLIIKYAVRAGVQSDQQPNQSAPPVRRSPAASSAAQALTAAHGVPSLDASDAIEDGPGLYRISGVDRETKMDTTWRVRADSPANARVKAELEGIVVTDVMREGD